ncbi:Protein of uncharacterised function (DUF3866) [Actinomyces bovis]|uniref:Protein of uncharacterized function (DUF3866) n=1 Tax=Actinomyces bovis TaxID=1658 RepID=A0ABY1VPT9_9ACTO|nr:DUF3866 family protein [Actinomyces bovis]SPT54020.1 Protein of uncharacterised function (DUF3866) [Actinomyces bovis]VEG53842.1 Protein of uncharacterised function (DUF3866) [Actinomyces israelii]
MMWREGVVRSLRRSWGPAGARCAELQVEVTAAPAGAEFLGPGQELRAVVYEQLYGIPKPGATVRVEVSALERRLGTGGHGMVTACLDELPADQRAPGHLVKCRYTPSQLLVQGVDEQDTAHHGVLTGAAGPLDLGGMPVVVADLHSSLPALLAGMLPAAAGQQPRVVYVMTDGGALPLAYSQAVAALREAGLLAGTVTVGQAWGGELEAVSIHNGLLAARLVLGADIAVVTQGPGNLGTDTPWGFSGVSCGEALNAAAVLGGQPVACLRVSQADARSRHQGVSHHSLTAYGKVALVAADVVVPVLAGALGQQVLAQARELCAPRATGSQHRLVEMETTGLRAALERLEAQAGLRLSTMGRGLDADEAAFLAAAAAGRHAAALAGFKTAVR